MTQNDQRDAAQRTGVRAVIPAPAMRSPDLRGPSGRLEALYVPGAADAPYAALVCHPHPLFGGTMHNKVVYHAAKVFQEFGLPVLRFNFRGAGASEGTHDRGEGEQEDLAAALQWLRQETGLPLLAAGFSFGAWVTLRTCCETSREQIDVANAVRGLVALGLPIEAGDRRYSYEFLRGCRLPKLFVSGAADAFGAVSAIEAAIAPATLVTIPGADHFFQRVEGGSGLGEMQGAVRGWLKTEFFAQATLQTTADAMQIGER